MDIKEIASEIWIYITEVYKIDVDVEDIEEILNCYLE